MIVVDASAAVEWLLHSAAGDRVAERIFSRPQELHAPHLLDLEVTQALRRAVTAGTLSLSRATEGLQDYLDLPIVRHSHEPILWRIWDLRDNLVAYDAAYVALAESLGATLLTCDAKLRDASGHSARVEVV
ncbi:MAG TPA: type II toxin-antitoxin system VapC family toxin [Candidatus Acidoferrales bacterium]|nr:type II toxin-antitoxin system VapC family toxin [Candidatus Acidoferrales bacterium]